jgi:hypothetical protein
MALLRVMVDPGVVVRTALPARGILWSLLVPAAAYALLFLQTGLDLAHAGSAGPWRVVALAGIGLAYGAAGVPALAALCWLLSGAREGARGLSKVMQSFAFSHGTALVYVALGLLANLLLGWNTSLCFGITGVLWAFSPLTGALLVLCGGRKLPAILLATLVAGLLLLGWGWIAG